MSKPLAYCPLDALLESPKVHALRKLRRFDWVAFEDLYPGANDNDKQAAWRALRKLVASRFVEMRIEHKSTREYRITAAGKAELQRVLAPPTEVMA